MTSMELLIAKYLVNTLCMFFLCLFTCNVAVASIFVDRIEIVRLLVQADLSAFLGFCLLSL